MAGESPVALLYDGYGKPLAVRDGYAFGSDNSALLLAGHDGSAVRVLRTNSDGYIELELNGATINLSPAVEQGAPASNNDAWPVRQQTSANATISTIAAITTDTLLVPANPNRKRAIVFNDSTAQLYIGLGTTTTDNDTYSFILAADTIWEIPEIFTGEVHGFWNTATGFARITELV